MYTYEGQKVAPGHEPLVEKVTHSTCPMSGKTSYALARERPTYLETTETIPRWGKSLRERNHPQVADPGDQRTPLCAHHWLVRLVRACSLLPRAPARGRQDAHWENWCFRLYKKQLPSGDHRQYEYALAYSEGPAISTDYRGSPKRLHALIRWLGGLQGWRTAVRDAEGTSALKKPYGQKEMGYSEKSVSTQDEAKGEGR